MLLISIIRNISDDNSLGIQIFSRDWSLKILLIIFHCRLMTCLTLWGPFETLKPSEHVIRLTSPTMPNEPLPVLVVDVVCASERCMAAKMVKADTERLFTYRLFTRYCASSRTPIKGWLSSFCAHSQTTRQEAVKTSSSSSSSCNEDDNN